MAESNNVQSEENSSSDEDSIDELDDLTRRKRSSSGIEWYANRCMLLTN